MWQYQSPNKSHLEFLTLFCSVLFVVVVLVWDRFLLCRAGWSWTHADVSAFGVLRSKASPCIQIVFVFVFFSKIYLFICVCVCVCARMRVHVCAESAKASGEHLLWSWRYRVLWAPTYGCQKLNCSPLKSSKCFLALGHLLNHSVTLFCFAWDSFSM